MENWALHNRIGGCGIEKQAEHKTLQKELQFHKGKEYTLWS